MSIREGGGEIDVKRIRALLVKINLCKLKGKQFERKSSKNNRYIVYCIYTGVLLSNVDLYVRVYVGAVETGIWP